MKLLSEHPFLIGRLVESFNARQAKLARRKSLPIALLIAVCLTLLMGAWALGARLYLSINP